MSRMQGRAALLLLLALVALPGCAESESLPSSETALKTGSAELIITSPDGSAHTSRSAMTIRGRVTPGSRVRVDGRAATVSGGRFYRRVRLHVGRNRIAVRAVGPGGTATRETVVVTRRRPKPTPVTAAPTVTPTPTPTPEPTPEPAQDCDASYKGACLDPHSPDYDCAGGSGDGPDYTGTVTVVGDDHFDLDRDGDGVGCEAS